MGSVGDADQAVQPPVRADQRIAGGSGNVQIAHAGRDVSVTINGTTRVLPLLSPDPLALAGMRVKPTKLVHPRYCPVPLVGRDREKGELLAWVEADLGPIAATVVHGQGGAGKTRLALEACRALGSDWAAGFLHGEAAGGGLDALVTSAVPRLVVVDYAETRAPQLEQLVELAAASGRPEPLRLLLLARQALGPVGDLTDDLLYNTDYELVLDEHQLSKEDRERLYRLAVDTYAAGVGGAGGGAASNDGQVLDTPLMVLVAAYLETVEARSTDPKPKTTSELLRALIDHERRYWTDLSDASESLKDRIIAACTLCPAPSEQATAEMLAEVVPDLADVSSERIRACAVWASEQYPSIEHDGSRFVAPVEPDLVGEHLVITSLSEAASWHAALRRSDSSIVQTLRVMQRLAADRPTDANPILAEALTETLTELVSTSIDQAANPKVNPNDLLSPPLAAVLQATTAEIDVSVLQQASDLLPPRADLILSPLRVESGLKLVGLYRDLVEADPVAYLPDLARSLNNLSVRLADAGRRDEALTAIEEAVTIRRDLVEANPAAYLPNLATSLNNLSIRLADAGRRDEALTAIEQAVTIRRDLAEANPAAYLPDLAMSLNNLSNRLAEAGRRDEALTAIEQAVTIRRDLAEANPAAYLPDLARSLINLSVDLGDAGRRDEALAAIEQAVTIRRDLAEANPAAYLPDLARSLNNLARALNAVGSDRQAAEVRQELEQVNSRL